MKKAFLLYFAIAISGIIYGQSEFKKNVDLNSKDLPFDDYSIQVIKENLVNSMNSDLNWQDKIVWIKGIVRNYEFASLDGKCKTEKGKVLYFAATAKSEKVLWDVESLPDDIKSKMEKHQQKLLAERNKDILLYSHKLKSFKDSLTTELTNKYNAIYQKSKIEFDSWNKKRQLPETDDCYLQAKFILNDLQSTVQNANRETEKIVWPIEVYESDFKKDDNGKAFQSIVKQASNKATDLDAIWSKKMSSLASKLTSKLKDCSVEKAYGQSLDSKWDFVNEEIGKLYVALFNKKNKKKVKGLISEATPEQMKFYNKYFADLNQVYGYDYHSPTTRDALRIELHKISLMPEKIEHLNYWQTNLKYWNEGLK